MPIARALARRQPRDVAPVEADAALGRAVAAGDAVDHGGLAGAVRADDGEDLAPAAPRRTRRSAPARRRSAATRPRPPGPARRPPPHPPPGRSPAARLNADATSWGVLCAERPGRSRGGAVKTARGSGPETQRQRRVVGGDGVEAEREAGADAWARGWRPRRRRRSPAARSAATVAGVQLADRAARSPRRRRRGRGRPRRPRPCRARAARSSSRTVRAEPAGGGRLGRRWPAGRTSAPCARACPARRARQGRPGRRPGRACPRRPP